MNYDGGKNGEGTWQWIINQMPPHDLYVELFAGSAAVLRRKRPARENIAVECDPAAIAALRGKALGRSCEIVQASVFRWLEEHRDRLDGRTLIYADPPYLIHTRRSRARMYRHELSYADHWRLLRVLKQLPAMVMISGYASQLYQSVLGDWRTASRIVTTRRGLATECIWMNYAEPLELHDYRFLGDGFRQREKICRQKARWVRRLARMTGLQRQALLSAIAQTAWPPSSETAWPAGHAESGEEGPGPGTPEIAIAAAIAGNGVAGPARRKSR